LKNDRPGVELAVHQMYGGAGDAHAVFERLTLSVETGERRKKGRMNIQNRVGKRLEKRRPHHAHVPSEADQINPTGAKNLDDRAIVGVAIDRVLGKETHRLEAGFASPRQTWRVRTIRDDDRDRRIELSSRNRVEDRL